MEETRKSPLPKPTESQTTSTEQHYRCLSCGTESMSSSSRPQCVRCGKVMARLVVNADGSRAWIEPDASTSLRCVCGEIDFFGPPEPKASNGRPWLKAKNDDTAASGTSPASSASPVKCYPTREAVEIEKLREDNAALAAELERIRVQIIGSLAKAKICMLVDSDPTAGDEIARAVAELAKQRDDALARVKELNYCADDQAAIGAARIVAAWPKWKQRILGKLEGLVENGPAVDSRPSSNVASMGGTDDYDGSRPWPKAKDGESWESIVKRKVFKPVEASPVSPHEDGGTSPVSGVTTSETVKQDGGRN